MNDEENNTIPALRTPTQTTNPGREKRQEGGGEEDDEEGEGGNTTRKRRRGRRRRGRGAKRDEKGKARRRGQERNMTRRGTRETRRRGRGERRGEEREGGKHDEQGEERNTMRSRRKEIRQGGGGGKYNDNDEGKESNMATRGKATRQAEDGRMPTTMIPACRRGCSEGRTMEQSQLALLRLFFLFLNYCMYVGTHPRKASPSLGKIYLFHYHLRYQWYRVTIYKIRSDRR